MECTECYVCGECVRGYLMGKATHVFITVIFILFVTNCTLTITSLLRHCPVLALFAMFFQRRARTRKLRLEPCADMFAVGGGVSSCLNVEWTNPLAHALFKHQLKQYAIA